MTTTFAVEQVGSYQNVSLEDALRSVEPQIADFLNTVAHLDYPRAIRSQSGAIQSQSKEKSHDNPKTVAE